MNYESYQVKVSNCTRLFEVFKRNPDAKFSILDLAEITNTPPGTVRNHVYYLEDRELVECFNFGQKGKSKKLFKLNAR